MTITAETIYKDVFMFRQMLHSNTVPFEMARRCLRTLWEEYFKYFKHHVEFEQLPDHEHCQDLTLEDIIAGEQFRDAESVVLFDVLIACCREASIAFCKYPELYQIKKLACTECGRCKDCDCKGVEDYRI
jgi:hypothetical protein